MTSNAQETTPVVSVVTPMFNEAANVTRTVTEIRRVLDTLGVAWELIMVDDGSTDETLMRAHAEAKSDPHVRVITYTPNRGRGYALRQGFRAAHGTIVLSTDFDLSYSADHLALLYQYLQDNRSVDMVLGSAYMPGGSVCGVPRMRLLISRVGNLLLRLAFPWRLHTITCVLRGYRREVLDSMLLVSNGKEIHLEILSKALDLGFNVAEIPATLTARKKGRSKSRLRRTSCSHLAFLFFEKPIIVFGGVGIVLLSAGVIAGGYVTYLRYAGRLNPARPLVFLSVLLVITGMQMISFGLLALLLRDQRRSLYRLQQQQRLLNNSATQPRVVPHP
ncbi:MAG: Undecaprenyl-phosphate mannosyltransferase [Alphaproteobacteria bacterium ADurb.BinA280]|nr:MAG: Undecaprenyl-phosphate mannosyltransferase [Alphaproteobacteria bacterium ADurb.BinA280]